MGYLIKESLCSFNLLHRRWFMEPEDSSEVQASAALSRGVKANCSRNQKARDFGETVGNTQAGYIAVVHNSPYLKLAGGKCSM